MAYSERQSYRVRRHRRRFGLRRWLFLGGGVLALAALVFLFLLLFTNVFQAPPQFLALRFLREPRCWSRMAAYII